MRVGHISSGIHELNAFVFSILSIRTSASFVFVISSSFPRLHFRIPQFTSASFHTPTHKKRSMPSPNERAIIREVWAENLDQEMALLRDLVDQYPYLAMVCLRSSSDMFLLLNVCWRDI